MACFYPKAAGLRDFWENILHRACAIEEIPRSHWDWRLYYDPDPRARDKVVSKWGGFLDDIPFDPLTYGITPKSLRSIEPLQLLLLEAVRHALGDAGYAARPFDRERTAAILGIGGGATPLACSYGFRTMLPLLDMVEGLPVDSAHIKEQLQGALPEWTEDSFPGFLMNVAVGRVANRFDLGGTNYAIDAACASSLAAVHGCLRELEMGTADMALAMGADTIQTPHAYMAFSKTHALSPQGHCRPFDAAADGIVLSEGIGVVVLKRLAEAERDGDRIYAVIRGAGSSSDGRDKGLTAPNAAGQTRALERAYAKAGISPARVGLIEAHGTGTVVGDQTEAQSLAHVLTEAGAPRRSCAVGSVKSMIGHTKCAAGVAGLIKLTKALYHKVLPPTLVDRPTERFDFAGSPLYLNTQARPWVHGADEARCAGVSAFGFGGTNTHVVLEEYRGDFMDGPAPPAIERWPAELFVWRAASRSELAQGLERTSATLARGARALPAELAASLWKVCPRETGSPTLAIVASSLADLQGKLQAASRALRAADDGRLRDPRGIWFAERPLEHRGKLALLFPGQGSQYPDMLAEIALVFPEVRQAFDRAEQLLLRDLETPLGRCVFPPSRFDEAEEAQAAALLARTDVAQPAIGAACLGMYRLLRSLGVEADLLAGHSYGELVALCAAGALSEDSLVRLSYRRGALMRAATRQGAGGMAAVDAEATAVAAALDGEAEVTLANINSPFQTVISGTERGLEQALARLGARGMRGRRLSVGCAFHSPLVAAASEPFARELGDHVFAAPRLPVLSNVTGDRYPDEPARITGMLAAQLTSPVLFQHEVERMYEEGARIFLEVGPQGVLTGLVGGVLGDRPHTAMASDLRGRSGIVQLQHVLAGLLASGVAVDLDRLHAARVVRRFDPAALEQETGEVVHSSTTWLVNGVRSRPIADPEPLLLGHAIPASGASARQVAPGHDRPADEEAVMAQFQALMARFLETQQSVMLAYLGHADAPSLPLAAAPQRVQAEERQPAEVGAVPAPRVAGPSETDRAEASPGGAAPTREAMSARLLGLVSERTGYPKEMLGLDLDLEAELGIDSIKRVEILSVLAESLNVATDLETAGSTLDLERLTGIRTLRGIIDYFDATRGRGGPTVAAAAATGVRSDAAREPAQAAAAAAEPAGVPPVGRGLIRLVDVPIAVGASTLIPRGAVLVTDDGRGVAAELAGRLADLGQRTVLLRMTNGALTEDDEDIYHADLTHPESVRQVIESIRRQVGPVAGLVHLLPLARASGDDVHEVLAQRDVKSLYLLARELEDEMRRAGDDGGAFLLAGTAMGGSLGINGEQPLPDRFPPGHGGILGFVKSLGQEWPEVLVRAVDLDDGLPAAELVDLLIGELRDRHGPPEVGYSGGRRVTSAAFAAPLESDSGRAPVIDASSTILLTGGARGITAAIARELARRYRCNLVLVGRSALPAAEAEETARLTTPAEIKAALIERRKTEGTVPAAAEIEAAYRRLVQDREIRANLARLRECGARVEYRSVDVRDERAVEAMLREMEQLFGGIDGVIHGAGVVEDKLVRDKTPDSFDRVFRTKVDGAMILSRRLEPRRAKFFVLFASVASRFGNRGQADYAAANEVLSKLAADLDRRWPGRVVSVAWGPWSGVGMASELERHFAARGVGSISPDIGTAFLLDELNHGSKGQSEVLIAGGTASPERSGGSRGPV
jgi:acyl transferase domain-containing protein